MKTLDYATYLAHPELRQEILQAAQRERAKVISELIFAPLARLIASLKARPQRLRASRWIAVHHGS